MPDGSGYQLNPRVEGGQVEEISVSDPAAGADFSYTLPDGYTYDLRGIAFQLVTSATVASRQPQVVITNASNAELARSGTTGATTASKTSQQNANPGFVGAGNSLTDVEHIFSMPMRGTRLLAGWKVKSAINALQATDQISNVRILAIRRPN